MRKICLLLLCALFAFQAAYAQFYTNQNKVWVFGTNAGLNFNSGSPVAFTTALSTIEGSASVCSSSGSLLFYTDGKNVYNASGSLMPHGSGIVSYSTFSTSQAVVIVPKMGSTTQYYVFSLEQAYGSTGACHLAYSIVDMSLDGGNGDLVTGSIGLAITSGLTERMTTVAGNSCDVWLVVHSLSSNQFYAYDISLSGIATTPVVSSVGSFSASTYLIGGMKFSPDRSKLVCQSYSGGGTELYDFDPSSGVVSNCRTLYTGTAQYGSEFSPDNSKLYTLSLGSGIYQYDLSLTSTTAIAASRTIVASGAFTDLKLGPDSKIYFGSSSSTGISCFATPNLAGTSCGLTSGVVTLSTGTHNGLDLPAVVVSVSPNDSTYTHHDTLACLPPGGSITIRAHDSLLGSGYLWDDGSTASTRVITSPGTYLARIYNGCGLKMDTIHVSVSAVGAVTGPDHLCAGSTMVLSDTSLGGVWSCGPTATATIGSGTGVVTGVASGPAVVDYTTPAGCIATKFITVDPLPPAPSGFTTLCVGSTGLLSDGTPGGTWSTGSITVTVGSASGVVTGVSAGTAIITYTLPTGCKTTITITVNPQPLPVSGVAMLCAGAATPLSDGTPGGYWSSSSTPIATVGSTTGIVSGLSGGTSIIDYTLSTGCAASVTVTVNPLPAVITGASSVCAGASTTLFSTAGGTWTSSTPAVATIGSSTGTVTGITAGVTTITYTLPTGCRITTGITVNPLPSVISGATHVCAGSNTLFADSVSGGTWSSSDYSVAMVDAGTGMVTGLSSGVATITYTSGIGCTATRPITVDAVPDMITGTGSVCVGATTTLYDIGGGSWSCTPAGTGTINALTGELYGVAAGIVTVSYTLPTGCAATLAVAVNPAPLPIAGTTALCLGLSTTLTDATPGGTWTSSSPSVATAGATSGIVTGGGTGTTVISYTLGTGCASTITVTVNSSPGPITGTLSGCVGATLTVSNTIAGGTWSITPTTIATVVPATGVITGVAPGTATVTYSLGAGCTATATIVINPQPGPVSGTATVCQGATTTLTDVGGGTWSSGNIPVATAGSTTGIITGISAGSAAITYTLPTGCRRSITVTVNPLPVPFSITGGGGYCTGGTGVHIGLSGSATGTTYQLYNGTTLVTTMAGTGTSLDFGLQTATGTYTITGTNPATTCNRPMTGTVTVTINPLPVQYSVGGGGSYCAGGTGLHISLGGSATGTTYQLYNGSTLITTVPGGVLDFGLQTAAGTYTVTATTTATGCSRIMTGSATITVNPVPPAPVGPSALCVGATIALTESMTGGTWISSTLSTATIGSTSGVITGIATGTTTITYTLPTGCQTTTTVTVSTSPLPIAGPSTVCTGSTATLTDVTGGGVWSSSSPAVALIGSLSGIVTGASTGTSMITYSLGSGCTVTRAVTVNAGPASISGVSSLCLGGTAAMTDGTPGGTWSITPTTTATISPTGMVSTVSAGIATVGYTVAGCTASRTVTINPGPTAIGGPATVCAATTITATNGTPGGIWSSPSSAITIDGTSGTISGISAGAATITYAIGSCTISRTITVNATPALSGATGLCTGTTATLTATIGGGTWSSSTPGTATIGATTGLITAVSPGTTTINYSLSTGCHAMIVVTVNTAPGPVSGASQVCMGSSTTLADGTGGGIWSVAPAGIATIGSTSGMVTGIATGTATVTYSLGSGCTVNKSLTINAVPAAISGPQQGCAGASAGWSDPTPGGIWSSGTPGIATAGSSTGIITGITAGTTPVYYTLATGCKTMATMTVNPLPAAISSPSGLCVGDAAVCGDADAGGLWSSSSPATAAIGSAGIITGMSGGTATISYTLPTGCAATRTIVITPAPAPITGSGNMCIGTTTGWSDITPGGSWTSGLPPVATVTTGGLLSGISAGTATITYSVSGCTATKTITVNTLPPAIGGPDHACIGGTISLTEPGSGTWSSSNPAVATVGSSTGTVTGLVAGGTIITYSLGAGCTATKPVTVNGLPTPITGTTHACLGGTSTLGNATAGGTWSSSNPAVATVSTTGVVTAISGGTATISYLLPTGCPATVLFTVITVPAITGVHNICAWGDTMTLHDANTTGIYTSTLATMTNLGLGTGRITGNAPGIASVTYILPTGCSTTATFTVNPLPNIVSGWGGVCTGTTRTLSDATPGGVWSSSNALIAAVGSSTGIVSGLTAGTARIAYQLTGTGCRVDTPITVYPTPAAIAGPASVFIGTPVTLTDATLGGVWSSSNTSRATITAAGVVSGVSTGTVTMTYNMGGGCVATKTLNIMPSLTGHKTSPGAGQTILAAGRDIRILPNPSDGLFAVELEWDRAEELQLTMMSMTGVVVQQQTVTTTEGTTTVPVRLNVSPGIYLLTITGSDTRYTARVVVR